MAYLPRCIAPNFVYKGRCDRPNGHGPDGKLCKKHAEPMHMKNINKSLELAELLISPKPTPNLIEIHAAGFHPMKQFAKGPILKMIEHKCSILLWYPSDHRAHEVGKGIEVYAPDSNKLSNPIDVARMLVSLTALTTASFNHAYYIAGVKLRKLPPFMGDLYGLKQYTPEECEIFESFGFQVRNGYVLERYCD